MVNVSNLPDSLKYEGDDRDLVEVRRVSVFAEPNRSETAAVSCEINKLGSGILVIQNSELSPTQ